jgi:hypothetical protein
MVEDLRSSTLRMSYHTQYQNFHKKQENLKVNNERWWPAIRTADPDSFSRWTIYNKWGSRYTLRTASLVTTSVAMDTFINANGWTGQQLLADLTCLLGHTPAIQLLLLASVSYICLLLQRRTRPVRSKKEPLSFSNIKALPNFNLATALPHPYRPWKAGKYQMTMGIRKMPEDEWLVLDNLYEQEQILRRHLLRTNRQGVMQCLPDAEKACEETLHCIVNFLTRRYPSQFCLSRNGSEVIHNKITNRSFKISAPYEQHPLEIAAQLAMEDINLLFPGSKGGENEEQYYLYVSNRQHDAQLRPDCRKASFSMAPAGWYIQERIGWPLYRIHGPVPMVRLEHVHFGPG